MKSLRCPKWKRVQTRLCQYILLPPQDSFCEHTHTRCAHKTCEGNSLPWLFINVTVLRHMCYIVVGNISCIRKMMWLNFCVNLSSSRYRPPFSPGTFEAVLPYVIKKKMEHVGRFPFNGSGWIFPTCCPRLQHKGLSIFVQGISRHSLLRRCECMLLWTSSK